MVWYCLKLFGQVVFSKIVSLAFMQEKLWCLCFQNYSTPMIIAESFGNGFSPVAVLNFKQCTVPCKEI